MNTVKKVKIIALVLLSGIFIITQGCATGKGCGCGNDINKSYKAPKRYR